MHPRKWRVNGPLSNIPEFYEAFGIKPGQPMYREAQDRVPIWERKAAAAGRAR